MWCVWRLPNLSAPFRGGWSCISILKGHLRQRLSQLNLGLLLGMQRDGRGEQKQLGGPLGPEQGDGPLKALPEPLRQSHRFLCLWWLVGSEMNEGQEGMVRTRENEHGNPSPLKSIQSRKNRGQGVPARHTSGATLSQKLPGAPPSQEILLPLGSTTALPPDPEQRAWREGWFSKAGEPCSLSLAPSSLNQPPQPPARCPQLPPLATSRTCPATRSFLPLRARTSPPAAAMPPPPTHALPSPDCFLPLPLPAGPGRGADKTARPSGHFPAGGGGRQGPHWPSFPSLSALHLVSPLGAAGGPAWHLTPLRHLLWGACTPQDIPGHLPLITAPPRVSPAQGPNHSGSHAPPPSPRPLSSDSA